jgi:Uma2 family endonuclease
MIVPLRTETDLMSVHEFYEFVNRPENRARSLELVCGAVIELSRPTRAHGCICANTTLKLELFARKKRKGYVVSNDSGVVLARNPDTVRGPNIAYYEDVQHFDDLPEKWGHTVPRLAAEVLSPNDSASYLTQKIQDYLDYGVEVVWIIDPETKTVGIYSITGVQFLTEKQTLTGGDVLPGFRVKVADLFALPEAKKLKRQQRPT